MYKRKARCHTYESELMYSAKWEFVGILMNSIFALAQANSDDSKINNYVG